MTTSPMSAPAPAPVAAAATSRAGAASRTVRAGSPAPNSTSMERATAASVTAVPAPAASWQPRTASTIHRSTDQASRTVRASAAGMRRSIRPSDASRSPAGAGGPQRSSGPPGAGASDLFRAPGTAARRRRIGGRLRPG